MARLRKSLPSTAKASATAPRPRWWLSLAALVFATTFAPTAAARQEDDCSAPGALLARAESLSAEWKEPSMRAALDGFVRARDCMERAGLRREKAGALKRIGDLRLVFSEYDPALEAYSASVALWREVGDQQAEGHALIDQSRALLFTARRAEALTNSQAAASTARALGDRRLEARAENVMGKFHYYLGDNQTAAAHYARALSLAREAGDAAEEALALFQTGQVHGDVGDLSEALAHHQSALPLWRAARDRQGEAKTLSSIGLTYLLLGESQTALDYLDRMALPSLREVGDRRGTAAALNSIGSLHMSLGDYETALSHFRDALAIFQQIGADSGQSVAAFYIGDACAQLGRTQEARESYERSLTLSRKIGNRLREAELLDSMGALSLSAGKADEAYELFRQALAVYEKKPYRRGHAAVLNHIGWYFGGRGDWREAAAHFRRALEFSRATGDRLGESQTFYNIARAELELGDDSSARSNVEAGLRIAESLRTKIAGSELRASYFASAHRQFELYVAVLMRLYRRDRDPRLLAAAFEASERGRARSLLETLAESRADIRHGVDPALLRRERELEFRLEVKAERRVQLLEVGTAQKEVAEIDRQSGELMAEYRRVRGQIRAASPRYAELMQPVPLSLKEIRQRVLDADTVLLEYVLGEERSFLWAVTPDSIKGVELPPRAEVERAARRVYELLTERNRRVKGETWQGTLARTRQAEQEYDAASAALSQMLLGQVAGELGRKRLVIVADGALQYVPFAALPIPSRSSNKGRSGGNVATKDSSAPQGRVPALAPRGPIPLIAEHEVVSLPSASVMALLREELRGRPRRGR